MRFSMYTRPRPGAENPSARTRAHADTLRRVRRDLRARPRRAVVLAEHVLCGLSLRREARVVRAVRRVGVPVPPECAEDPIGRVGRRDKQRLVVKRLLRAVGGSRDGKLLPAFQLKYTTSIPWRCYTATVLRLLASKRLRDQQK